MGNIEAEIERLRIRMQPETPKVVGVSRRKLADSCFKAVAAGRFLKVKFLLDNGVSESTLNDHGQNLLVAALYIPDEDKRRRMVQYLLSRGVPCAGLDNNGRDVLCWACILGIPKQVQQIAEAAIGNIDLHLQDKQGMTPLHHATRHGQIEVVRILINMMDKFRLSVDVQDVHGLTPYLYARRLGHFAIADLLVREGRASKKQFDSSQFHSAEDWTLIGAQERRQSERNAKQRQLALYKIRGRLPPMSQQQRVMVPRIKLPADEDDEEEDHHVPGALTGRSVDTALALLNLHPDARLSDQRSEMSSNASHGHMTSRDTIPTIMDILADQTCPSFRATAKLPPVNHDKKHVKSRMSTLAILMGKNKGRPDHKRRQHLT